MFEWLRVPKIEPYKTYQAGVEEHAKVASDSEEIVDNRVNRIARRLARRAIREVSKGNTALDVRGPLNMWVIYRSSRNYVYEDAVYDAVNQNLSEHRFTVDRTSPSMSYYAWYSYFSGSSHPAIKYYDRMHITRERLDEGRPPVDVPPPDPGLPVPIPDFVPKDWEIRPSTNERELSSSPYALL